MTSGYEPVIGLEVHAQLKTASKAFCACPTTFGAMPNVNVCPICLGHPGTLPVLNRILVEWIVRMGLATNCSIRERSGFARKNYFYSDLPKGYQISQYADPICFAGSVEIETETGPNRIGITRIHMEEDSGKSIHDLDVDTLVDLNRAGVPLIEIVSEPDIRSPNEAYLYLQQIRQTLVYLGICDGNLEEGSLRCDANISIRPVGQVAFGTKTEVKNLNSFRNVEKAIQYEIERQIESVEGGTAIQQVTMMWDASKQQTKVMRTKEQAHDYRYFAEPDLVLVVVDQSWQERLRASLPELGLAKKRRFMQQYGLPMYDADVLTDDAYVSAWYEAVCVLLEQQSAEAFKLASNWIMTEVMRIMSQSKVTILNCGLQPEQIASLVNAIQRGDISSKLGKDVFSAMLGSNKLADTIIQDLGFRQESDVEVLRQLVLEVIRDNPDNLEKLKSGKSNLFGYFVGQVLNRSGGSANPAIVSDIMKEALEEGSQ